MRRTAHVRAAHPLPAKLCTWRRRSLPGSYHNDALSGMGDGRGRGEGGGWEGGWEAPICGGRALVLRR
jgi:hypothetical protein